VISGDSRTYIITIRYSHADRAFAVKAADAIASNLAKHYSEILSRDADEIANYLEERMQFCTQKFFGAIEELAHRRPQLADLKLDPEERVEIMRLASLDEEYEEARAEATLIFADLDGRYKEYLDFTWPGLAAIMAEAAATVNLRELPERTRILRSIVKNERLRRI
jgi:uncharacterized protein involved in exopolysaccharide biosynthesis